MTDVVAFGIAIVGLILAANGLPLIGAVLYAGPLVGLAVAINRRSGISTLLPFSFPSHFVVMISCAIVAIIARNSTPAISVGCFAFFTYYYGCVSLKERKARYVPWGVGVMWRTVSRSEHPRIYWSCAACVFLLAGSLFALLFARATRFLP